MKRLLLITALAALASLGASAGTVAFSTTGSELCIGANGCGSDTVTFGDTILTYAPSTSIVTPDSNVNLGTLSTSCVGGGTACGMSQLPAGLALYLNINQTTPASGNGNISAGMLVGSISANGSSGEVNWSGLPSVSFTTSGVTTTYSLLGNFLPIVPPSNNNCSSCPLQPSGSATIEGIVTQTQAPEPGSILLLSTGLAGFVLARRKRLV